MDGTVNTAQHAMDGPTGPPVSLPAAGLLCDKGH